MRTVQDFDDATKGGCIFTATFRKRTTGEVRVMNCRREVTKHLKGGTLAYDPGKKNLLPVYDLQAKGYRQIDLDGLLSVKCNGCTFNFVDGVFHHVG